MFWGWIWDVCNGNKIPSCSSNLKAQGRIEYGIIIGNIFDINVKGLPSAIMLNITSKSMFTVCEI